MNYQHIDRFILLGSSLLLFPVVGACFSDSDSPAKEKYYALPDAAADAIGPKAPNPVSSAGSGSQDSPVSVDPDASAQMQEEPTPSEPSPDAGTPAEGSSQTGTPGSDPVTPKNIGFGKRKTITIDGKNTSDEWGADTLLVTDPAADDARFLGTNWCAHEGPIDYSSLHAAWDDENLYVGIQLVDVTDVIDSSNAGSAGGLDLVRADMIQFIAINTLAGAGYASGGDMWKKSQGFAGKELPDFQLYFHSNFSQEGTYMGKWMGAAWTPLTDGKKNKKLTGMGGHFYVGPTLMGVDPKSDDATPGQYTNTTVDYLKKGHDIKRDSFFELAIPLTLLDINASRLDTGNISIFCGHGEGNGVDSIPNDPATSSTPGISDSNSPLEWNANVDKDDYTSPFAWIGKTP